MDVGGLSTAPIEGGLSARAALATNAAQRAARPTVRPIRQRRGIEIAFLSREGIWAATAAAKMVSAGFVPSKTGEPSGFFPESRRADSNRGPLHYEVRAISRRLPASRGFAFVTPALIRQRSTRHAE